MTSGASLAGRTAFISGASSGFGAHFASVLAGAGARLVLAARRTEALEALAARLGGGPHRVLSLDLLDPTSIEAAAVALSDVDILINNAGIAREGAFLDQTEAAWDAVVDTNVKGMFLMTQAAGRAMRAQGRGGSIINIASILGIRQASGVAPYAISKAAVVQLTRVAALELARFNVRVNALAPGYFSTDLNQAFFESDAGRAVMKRIPLRRLGRLDDLTGPLLLLATDASAYMTGAVIEVDGGHLVSGL